MVTKLLEMSQAGALEEAAQIIKDGGLVGIPTETVYGLAANALDGTAVAKIFAAKGRPVDNPLIVHISEFDQIRDLVTSLPPNAEKLAQAFWPGPLTMVLPKSDLIPDEVSAGLPTVAVRFPSHPVARSLISACGLPLAAPSANTSGMPSPTTAAHVMHDLNGKIDAVLNGGPCGVGVESTVISFAANPPRLLRPGGITLEQLRFVLGEVDMDDAVLNPLKEGETAASPGMKYKHYSPKANIIILDGNYESFCSYVNSHGGPGVAALCYDGEEAGLKIPAVCYGKESDCDEQARELFDALRALDEQHAKTVYARCPEPKGVGLAVYNRLIRAAGFERISLAVPVIGLTGPSGAGKSTVAAVFLRHGCHIIDSDLVAREIVAQPSVQEKLKKAFGEDIVTLRGTVNHALLAKRAFQNHAGAEKLNAITHPAILEEVENRIRAYQHDDVKAIVVDAALLFESGANRFCTITVAVTAPVDVRLQRIMERDLISREQAQARILAQQDNSYYRQYADYCIDGGKPLEQVIEFAIRLLRTILA